jgi:glycosyltransferase involved in cell wall biosynthesis
MITPIVSVVMSVFNGERFLREAMESILDQSFREFEFIVIDDGSTDSCPSILDSYREKDSRVLVYHQENRGLIASLNRGCSIARGKYIARMDADDVSVRDRLRWQVDFMETHPRIAVLGGAVEWVNAVGRSLGTYHYPCEDRQIKAAFLRGGCALWHPTVVLRREVFVGAGGYRSVLVDAEDYDLWLRIGEHFELANLEPVVLKYRIHPDQVSMRKGTQQALAVLAAQLSASARSSGMPDPLNSISEITPEILAALGVGEAKQQNRTVFWRRDWLRNLYVAGEYSAVLKAAREILQSDLKYAERWQVADLYLMVAKIWLKQKKFAKGFLAIGHAVITRPVVVVDILGSVFRQVGRVRSSTPLAPTNDVSSAQAGEPACVKEARSSRQ